MLDSLLDVCMGIALGVCLPVQSAVPDTSLVSNYCNSSGCFSCHRHRIPVHRLLESKFPIFYDCRFMSRAICSCSVSSVTRWK